MFIGIYLLKPKFSFSYPPYYSRISDIACSISLIFEQFMKINKSELKSSLEELNFTVEISFPNQIGASWKNESTEVGINISGNNTTKEAEMTILYHRIYIVISQPETNETFYKNEVKRFGNKIAFLASLYLNWESAKWVITWSD